jgi:hypothetical protein
MPLSSGTRLGPYEIVVAIGAGGMGEVYRARDPRLGRDVALKVLPRAVANELEALTRFEREARAIAAISHPHILAIYDTGLDGDVAYVVTELVEGVTLREAIAAGPLPQRKAIEYGVQIARGLAAAHERGIVHRDLKPENIIIGTDGLVKILDFGLARSMAADPDRGDSPTLLTQTAPGVLLGTVGYLAPEQARGAAVDHRADLFSLGCVLYEMLAGRSPFHRETPAETLAAILREDPPPLSPTHTSPILERVIARCLEKSPGERFQSARDVAFALDAVSGASTGGEAVVAAPAPRRRRWVVPAALVLAVLAVLVSFVAGTRVASRTSGSTPRFTRLSFDYGTIRSARFSPDGATIVYGGAWQGEAIRIFQTRTDNVRPTRLDLPPADVLSVSSSGELLISLGRTFTGWVSNGTLAQVPLLGSSPRPLLADVRDADRIPATDQMIVVRRINGRDQLEFPVNHRVYATRGYVSHPKVSADGTRVAFLDHPLYGDDRGFVAVVDRAGRWQHLTEEYQGLEGLAWSPDGDEIWFSGTPSGKNFTIDAVAAAGGPARRVYDAPTSLQLLDVRENGQALVTAQVLSGTIHGRGPRDAFERDLAWGGFPVARAVSADGTLVAGAIVDAASADYDAFVRPIDGAQPVSMGHGSPQDISSDNRWLLTMTPSQPPKVLLVPIGPGDPRRVDLPGISPVSARFFPGGDVFVAGTTDGGRQEWLRVRLADGHRESIAHPPDMEVGFAYGARVEVSPDAPELAYAQPGRVFRIPLAGGEPRVLLALGSGETFVRWGADTEHVFVAQSQGNRTRVFRVAVITGRREPVHDIFVTDRAGALSSPNILLSRNGDTYVYWFGRMVGSLYLVDGLR